MANKGDLRIAVVEDAIKTVNNALLKAINDAYDLSLRLTDAQDGDTVLGWSRILFDMADTGSVKLTMTATTKKLSCVAGSGLLDGFVTGRKVQITGFTVNATNNQTALITAVGTDEITIGDATDLVDEVDTSARAQMNTTSDEQGRVTGITNQATEYSAAKDFLDNEAVVTKDRRDIFMDGVW